MKKIPYDDIFPDSISDMVVGIKNTLRFDEVIMIIIL
jgi:hypothetical protein